MPGEAGELGLIDSLLLGIVQGLTEFLPVSSSGHLALTQHWLDVNPEAPDMLLFNVLAHVGTLLAVLWVFRRRAWRLSSRAVAEIIGRGQGGRLTALRVLGPALFSTFVTAAIGLPLQDRIEQAFGNRMAIGAFLMITGLILLGTRWTARGTRGWRRLGWIRAGLIGAAQAGAILPGISRSGATICAAMYLGCRRRVAAEYSFLIAIPAICGGAAKKILDTLALPRETIQSVSWSAMAIGMVVSMLVGVGALHWLLHAARRGRLDRFAWYCIPVGLLVIMLSAG